MIILPGVTVHLFACGGDTVLQTAITDSMGVYGFFVEPGSYQVHFVKPVVFAFTL
ncbi:MAG TPA: SdrD B-like domain-containing protein [Anaerolineales bacterium]|nr:SdrD B-like domain-containing protein [Anaerolineales bacterium]